MDTAEAQRLLEEQTAAIQLTEQRAEQLTKFKEDYEALHKRLETLPDKLTHDVMVPFGKLAFMPGKLVHTNEITVLLGDNWFVDRSAKQACGIIDRRVDVIKKQLSELEQQKGLLEPRRQFTEDLWDVGREQDGAFEIREAYDEQKEREWKKKHRKNMKKYRQEQKVEEDQLAAATPAKEPLTDVELWARLDELEDQERKDREMDKLDEEIVSGETTDRTREGDRGTDDVPEDEDDDDDDDDETEEDEDSDDYEDDDDEEEEQAGPPRPVSIRFSHTKTDVTQPQPGPSKPTVSAEGTPVITSPSDIYTHYMGPRSILKSPGSPGSNGKHRVTITEPDRAGTQGARDRRQDAPTKPQPASVTPKAFTGAVVERQDTTQVTAPGLPEPTAPQPRVSKFKAQRMKQQNR